MLEIQLIGNIGKDAEVRNGGNGMSAIGFNVATSKKLKGENVTTWVKCTKWVKEGDTKIADYLKKGTKVFVSGEVGIEMYQEKSSLTCRVGRVELCGGGDQGVKQHDTVDYSTQSDPFAEPVKVEDDLPF